MKVSGTVVSEKKWDHNFTDFDITFDQTVTVTEYYFPEFSFSDFLSRLGGSLGLWLGIGVTQIIGFGLFLLTKLKFI